MNIATLLNTLERVLGRAGEESAATQWIVDRFHALYYHAPRTWPENRFLGVGIRQSPNDLWIYQELVYDHRPKFIVQTGILEGGSMLYFATLLDLVGADPACKVIGIDIEQTESALALDHPRIELHYADSVAESTLEWVKEAIAPCQAVTATGHGPGIVILDSDHRRAHVEKELDAYSPLVEPGSYLVVEDTNINGHPVYEDFGEGPMEAVDAFLARRKDFVRDDMWKRHFFSFHQDGWLRRTRRA